MATPLPNIKSLVERDTCTPNTAIRIGAERNIFIKAIKQRCIDLFIPLLKGLSGPNGLMSHLLSGGWGLGGVYKFKS
jgi:hypothetical protein